VDRTDEAGAIRPTVQERTGFDPTLPFNSVEDTAAYAGVSRALGYQLSRSGEWPSVRMGRRLMVVTARWLEKYRLV
jgi:hypothetical protein